MFLNNTPKPSNLHIHMRMFLCDKEGTTLSPCLVYRTIYSSATRTFAVSESTSQNSISSLEHVVIKTSLSINGVPYYSRFDYDDLYDALYYTDDIYDWLESPHARRGDIKIELTSPQGTKSVLLPYRNYDFVNEEGYDNWPFMSVHFWGENPVGTWTLKIIYTSGSGYVSMSGLRMTLYGTASVPSSVSSIPTNCHSSCVRGCSGSGPSYCDSCVHYRLASNLTCVDQCPSNTHTIKKYCYENSDAVSRTTTVSSSGGQSSSSETSTTSSSKAQTTTSSSTSRGTETTETSTGQTSTSSSSKSHTSHAQIKHMFYHFASQKLMWNQLLLVLQADWTPAVL